MANVTGAKGLKVNYDEPAKAKRMFERKPADFVLTTDCLGASSARISGVLNNSGNSCYRITINDANSFNAADLRQAASLFSELADHLSGKVAA